MDLVGSLRLNRGWSVADSGASGSMPPTTGLPLRGQCLRLQGCASGSMPPTTGLRFGVVPPTTSGGTSGGRGQGIRWGGVEGWRGLCCWEEHA